MKNPLKPKKNSIYLKLSCRELCSWGGAKWHTSRWPIMVTKSPATLRLPLHRRHDDAAQLLPVPFLPMSEEEVFQYACEFSLIIYHRCRLYRGENVISLWWSDEELVWSISSNEVIAVCKVGNLSTSVMYTWTVLDTCKDVHEFGFAVSMHSCIAFVHCNLKGHFIWKMRDF